MANVTVVSSRKKAMCTRRRYSLRLATRYQSPHPHVCIYVSTHGLLWNPYFVSGKLGAVWLWSHAPSAECEMRKPPKLPRWIACENLDKLRGLANGAGNWASMWLMDDSFRLEIAITEKIISITKISHCSYDEIVLAQSVFNIYMY